MTDYKFRYAIFARVSSDPQAKEDKASLPDQVRYSRAYGNEEGGIETAGPFIGDGFSASNYDSLKDAIEDIPALKEAVSAAEKNLYDVLIVDNWDRLGDLPQMMFNRLTKKLEKQLRSARQSGKVQDPRNFNKLAEENTQMEILFGSGNQIYRINRMNRGYTIGMPKRIENGLNPSRTPYAYTYVNSKTPPTQNPEKVARWLAARDAFMDGKAYTEIADILGVVKSRVPYVLGNPFYAGIVTLHKMKTYKVGTKWRHKKLPKSKHLTGTGKHEPIISLGEHLEIVAEIERRYELKRRKTGWVFTGLLRCSVCKSLMRRGKFWNDRPMIFCRAVASHVAIDYDEFFVRAGKVLGDALARSDDEELETRQDQTETIQKAIKDYEQRRKNVIEMGEAGAMKPHEVAARVRELEAQSEKLQNDIERGAQEKVNRAVARESMQGLDLSHFGEYLKTGNAVKINRMLAAWLKEIRVSEEGIELIER